MEKHALTGFFIYGRMSPYLTSWNIRMHHAPVHD